MPGLLRGGLVAIVEHFIGQQLQLCAVVLLLIAHQQVQARAGYPGDQFRPVQGQAMGVLGVEYHQYAADGLHDHDLPGK
ncbi:hypothetical protein D3C80_1377610 [compost metagenome]